MARKQGPIDSLESAKRKLARATKHLKSLKRSIAKYSSSRPYKVIPVDAKGKKTTHLKLTRDPSLDISVLAGEMIYQMRSALDHLAFGLVKRNVRGITLPPRWEQRCDFPLLVDVPLTSGNHPVPHKLPLPYGVLTKTLPGISQSAYAFIESLQPYNRKTIVHAALAFLAKLSNIDKHRYLNIMGVRIYRRQIVRYASGLGFETTDVFDHGAKFDTYARGKPDRPVYVNRRYSVFVTFNERAAVSHAVTLPLDQLLKIILEQIRTVIVPAFEQFLK